MKHLTPYKLFESFSEQEQTIIEICYDLADIGFNIAFSKQKDTITNKNNDITTSIIIYKPPKTGYMTIQQFRLNDEIKEVLFRIKDYLGDKFKYLEYDCDRIYPGEKMATIRHTEISDPIPQNRDIAPASRLINRIIISYQN